MTYLNTEACTATETGWVSHLDDGTAVTAYTDDRNNRLMIRKGYTVRYILFYDDIGEESIFWDAPETMTSRRHILN